jgi:hypothetical protein
VHDTSSQYGDHFCRILLQGHAVTLTFKEATQMFARDTCSQYDHFCEIFLKSDFKKPSYWLDTNLLQSHAMTLTFKVATQMLHATRLLNMVIISVTYF